MISVTITFLRYGGSYLVFMILNWTRNLGPL